jgi:phenylalanyl-tRNA synthetase alpha chain
VSAAIQLQQLTDQLDGLEAEAAAAIAAAATSAELEDLRVQPAGQEGQALHGARIDGALPAAERPLVGQRANCSSNSCRLCWPSGWRPCDQR